MLQTTTIRSANTRDAGLAVLRGVSGGLMAGHGAQKLFGAFKGPGLAGTAGFMESLGLQPGRFWGTAAALSEFCGGTLTTLGLLNPLGPISTISSMAMATAKAHWGKPIWITSGGAEAPLLNIAVATSLMLTGPGKISLDEALGIRLPKWFVAAACAAAAAGVGYGIVAPQLTRMATSSQPDQTAQQERQEREERQEPGDVAGRDELATASSVPS